MRGIEFANGLLADTNVLVLYVVGTVNRDRISTFKRTRRYDPEAYDLLRNIIDKFPCLYTVPHILAEVSNLTDLEEPELERARLILAKTITLMRESSLPSVDAIRETAYRRLGLTDAAIAAVARQHNCTVLTDDLPLYVLLSNEGLPVINFTHARVSQL